MKKPPRVLAERLVRKLRTPGLAELAIGAVDEAGTVVEGRHFDLASPKYRQEEIRTQREILRKRRAQYTRAHAAIDPAGRVVMIVDDGIATGSSMLAAIHSVRAKKPRKIVVAIAAAPPESLAVLEGEADEVVCLQASESFLAVGQFFADFREVIDDMVVAALAHAPAAVKTA